MPKFTLYAVITSDGCDQICETKASANAEIFDLRAMGFDPVRCRKIHGIADTEDDARQAAWEAAYARYPNA